jgi:hypothetical protein
MNATAWVGLAIMVVSEGATLAQIDPFWSWNTPIAWTGFILFADGIVWQARGNSWLRSNRREFLWLALASIVLWLVFEAYNLTIRNWYYGGLPENDALRLFGYAWAFATIWPAIFEGSELIAVWRAAPPGGSLPCRAIGPTGALSMAVGALMLASPFLVSSTIAPYMAAPVWLGFIFLLDPVNAALGGESLLGDLRAGNHNRLINLSLSGLLCGLLWEFWNYWSHAKWIYTVPIMQNVKLFEMPLPGYLGFPAFAIECFTMYVFVRLMYSRLASTARERGGAGRPANGTQRHAGRAIAL